MIIHADPRSRHIAEHSPDRGGLAFGYDSASRLVTVTDARGVTAILARDAADRLTSVAYPDRDGFPPFAA